MNIKYHILYIMNMPDDFPKRYILPMTKTEFAGEFEQILRFLREHAYLQYSSSTQAEYEKKTEAGFWHFRELVREGTGIELAADKAAAGEIARMRSPTVSNAARELSRAGRRLTAAGREEDARPWLLASEALRVLR